MEALSEVEIADIASFEGENFNSYLRDYFATCPIVPSDDEDDGESSDDDVSDIDTEVDETEDVDRSVIVNEADAILRNFDFVDTDKEAEMRKIADKSCGCKKFEDGQCMNLISDELIYTIRLNMSEKSESEKDLMLLAIISTIGGRSEKTQCSRRKLQKDREKPRGNYQVDGVPVCRIAFEFIYG